MAELTENIPYKHFYTVQERDDLSRKLAEQQLKKVELEDEKKAVTSDYKAKIDSVQSSINLLSRDVINGYTTKMVLARKTKDFDRKVWVYTHPDTEEEIKTVPLTGADLQMEVELTEEELTEETTEMATDQTAEDDEPGEPTEEAEPVQEQPQESEDDAWNRLSEADPDYQQDVQEMSKRSPKRRKK
ncbi:hypothetical protein DYU11_22720 [Fibrisoma montanum]|uniref:Uncharacterized protein n=1 Tax=Fibrisoma montanum TaxID=2305895 RepID=A0A418M254_9BACT|nr:hypothetical protein [Fibrisoma montanum]RIV19746.1 hypothetical protein DYU11_22720 [Fibrisoma montanum]